MLQAIFCKPDGTKTILYDGELCAMDDERLSDLERKEILSAKYVDKAAEVPQEVTRAQFMLALVDTGLYSAIDSYISNSEDLELKINWKDRLYFERNNHLIIKMATVLNKTPEDIDNLFILAYKK